MFMLSMGAGTNIAFPDVCKTPMPPPVGMVPLPYPNTSMSSTSSPPVANVLVDCMPSLNLMSKGMVSAGDNTGVLGGVASNMMSGQTNYIVGCMRIFVGGAPAQRMTSVTGQNSAGMMANAPGMCLIPSQVSVLTLG